MDRSGAVRWTALPASCGASATNRASSAFVAAMSPPAPKVTGAGADGASGAGAEGTGGATVAGAGETVTPDGGGSGLNSDEAGSDRPGTDPEGTGSDPEGTGTDPEGAADDSDEPSAAGWPEPDGPE
jgi:hypothetical protein